MITDIITPHGLVRRKLKMENNHIIIKEPKKGRGGAGYKAKFDKSCIITFVHKPLWPLPRPRFLKQKLMLIDGADKCISFRFEEDKVGVDMPVWNREMEEKLFEANVIKASGQISSKLKVPSLLYILLIASLAVCFLTFLVVSGRLHL